MSVNRNGYQPHRVSKISLRDKMYWYDTLTPEQRKVLQDAPYSITIRDQVVRNKTPEELQKIIDDKFALGVFKTYGPTHPQAMVKETA